MHSRQKIRDAVTAKLTAHTLLTKLFEARTKPAGEESLPSANVISGTETVEDLADQFRELRTLQVSIVLEAKQAAGVVVKLDDLAEQVESLLSTVPTLGGVCEFFRYKGCDPDYDSASAQEAASLTLNYECKYVWEPVPVVNTLTTVQVSVDMAGPRNDPQLPSRPDGQIDASATITLP